MFRTPPAARKEPVTRTAGSRKRVDEYAWLENADWLQAAQNPKLLHADVRAHLEAENAYTEALMAPVESLRDSLLDELRGRIKEEDSSVPKKDGDWEYYFRYREGGEHPLVCRHPAGKDGDEQILLDGDAESAGSGYFRIGNWKHSPDHRYLAWTEDRSGSECYRLRIADLEAGQHLRDSVEGCANSLEWGGDCQTIFYVAFKDHLRPQVARYHRIGSESTDDVLVYEEAGAGFYVFLSKSESKRFVLIHASDHITSEIRLIEAHQPETPPVLIEERTEGTKYYASHHEDRLLLCTNADGCEDFKIVEMPFPLRGRETWKDLVPYRPGILILGFRVYADWLVWLEQQDALPRIMVRHLASGKEHAIRFEDEPCSLSLIGGGFNTDLLRFGYSSMTTPERIYDHDMHSQRHVLRKEQELPKGHDPADYISRRITAVSHDNTPVFVSLLYHKETAVDGSAPALLFGYGAYGLSVPASFGSTRLSLVDRGFVYAIAHVRGGCECGYAWYTAGRRRRKENTIHDFLAAAHALIDESLTRPGAIALHGISAGGLLVGACINRMPELFYAAVAEVPLVDALSIMCDETVPLMPTEQQEWGNPLSDDAEYEAISAYDPYGNVTAQAYPHVLATAGLADSRVPYWAPAKWVARLRTMNTGDRFIALHTDFGAGHSGSAGRLDRLGKAALILSFLLHVYNLDDRSKTGFSFDRVCSG